MSNRIILINQKTKQIEKIYENAVDVRNDLKLNKNIVLYYCLNNKTNHVSNYILKYEKDVSDKNIDKWCEALCWTSDGKFRKCPKCKEWFNIEDIHGGYCGPCRTEKKYQYSFTLNGYFENLHSLISLHCKQRAAKGQLDKSNCEIKTVDLKNMYNNQNNLCFYSDIVMSPKRLSDWQCSAERIDESKGYTLENTKLICLEFNTSHVQWSREKIKKIPELINTIINSKKLIKRVETARFIKQTRKYMIIRKPIIKDGKIYYSCNKCLMYFLLDKFRLKSGRPYSCCLNCEKICKEEFSNTLKGFLLSRLHSAKNRGQKKSMDRDQNCKVFTLTLDNLCDKIIEQKGRCYYSNIPLIFKNKSEWMCSIERIDNNLGYTNENTVLICIEFNTSDFSSVASHKTSGSAQWSKDKFKVLMDHINK